MRLLAIITAALFLASISSCTPPSGGAGSGPSIGFISLETPNGAGGWGVVSGGLANVGGSAYTHVFQVLPVQGRGVRINLVAPVGTVFDVTILSAGVVTALTQNSGTPTPPDDGYFQIISVDPGPNPPVYKLYVRAPANLADPNYYTIGVASASGGASGPMMPLTLTPPTFVVNVNVQGGGYVTSSPPGINCGTSPTGGVLNDCTIDFGSAGPVRLSANPNTPGDFREWTGDCSQNQTDPACSLANTRSAMTATAVFAGAGATITTNACTQPPPLVGFTWIGQPQCSRESATSETRGSLGCDAGGYFCCSTPAPGVGPGDPRCANGGWEYPPDCRNQPNDGLNAVLRHPGGCYRIGG